MALIRFAGSRILTALPTDVGAGPNRSRHRAASVRLVARALLLAVALGGTSFAADTPKPLTNLVGDDAGLCVELNGLETHVAGFLQSEMYRRLSETTVVKSWRAGNDFHKLNTAIGHVEKLTGRPAGKLAADLFGRSLVLAAYSNGREEPTGVLLTRTRSREVLEAALAAWGRAAPKDDVTELRFQGQVYYRRAPDKPDGNEQNGAKKKTGRSIYYVTLNDVFALSDREEAVRDVITRSRSIDGKSLAGSKLYQAARRTLTGKPAATVFFNPRKWDDSIQFDRKDGPATPVIKQLWKHCRSIVIGIRLDGGCVTEVVADFDSSGLPAAWGRFAKQTAGVADFLAHVPQEAVLAIAGKYDPSLIFTAIRPQGNGADEKRWKELHAYGRAFLLGVDLSTDLVPNLKPNGGLYVVPRATSNKAVFPFDGLAAFQVASATGKPDQPADRFRARLDRGIANGVTVLATFYNISIAKGETNRKASLAEVRTEKRHGTLIRWIDGVGAYRPAVAITKKYLVVASTPDLIEDFVAPTKKNRLLETTVFERWKRDYFPSGNQLIFVNVRGLREHVLAVRPVLIGWLAGGRTEKAAKPVGKKLDRALDLLQVIDGAFAAAHVEKSRVRLVFGGVVKPADARSNE